MGKGEGKGGKAMVTATRVAGERTATATKRAMAAMTRTGGCRGWQWPTFAHHTTMTHDHRHDGDNDDD